MSAVVRMLRWYERTPAGRLVGEAVLSGVRLSDLQTMFVTDQFPVRPNAR